MLPISIPIELEMMQSTGSNVNPYAFVFMRGENMFPRPITVKIQLTESVLYPPNPNASCPTTRGKPLGCKTVFVGGLPKKITEDIIEEIFERCGTVDIIRMSEYNFCHVRFTEEIFVENAIYFSGYLLKIENKDEPAYTGRLHVDYALARDDLFDYEYKQVYLQYQALHQQREYFRSVTPPVVHYTDHKVFLICEKLKIEGTFVQAASILLSWLERGECSKKNAGSFYSMIQSTHNHVRKLQDDKMKCEEQLNEAKKMLKKQLEGTIRQFTDIGKIYRAASLQKCWDHFTKAQRKNIEMWKKQAEKLRNEHIEEVINEREDEEMEFREDENDESFRSVTPPVDHVASLICGEAFSQAASIGACASSWVPAPRAGLEMMQPISSSVNPHASVTMTEKNMFSRPIKEIIQLTLSVLYPPNPNAPRPTTRGKPIGCKTVFVGGLPEKINDEILREIFERCGTIEAIRMSKKNFCHIRFSDEIFVENAIYFSGYRLKIENKDEPAYTGRLHVDYAQARDDQFDYECKQRSLQRQARHQEQEYFRSVTPPVVHYTDHEASLICEKLKSEETFVQAAIILVSWLERGECSKKNAGSFYSMIQSTHNHVRKFQVDKMKYEEQLNKAKKMLKKQLEGIIRQFTEISKIYKAASLQKCRDHFTKAQRKNIEMWKKQTEELRNAYIREVINKQEDEEMELSEDENNESFRSVTPPVDHKASLICGEAFSQVASKGACASSWVPAPRAALEIMQPTGSSVNSHASMTTTEKNMFSRPLKEKIELTRTVLYLYPPDFNVPHPKVLDKPIYCKTVLVHELPENITKRIIEEIFKRCGTIKTIRMGSKKDSCHIRFTDGVFADNAIYFTGYQLKVENNDKLVYTGRLLVDYARARDDLCDFKRKYRSRTPPPLLHVI